MRALTVALVFGSVLPGATWQIDPSHSSAQFAVRHMMVSNVRGEFSGVKGTAVYDPANLAASKLDVTIDTTTLNTREPKRDAHLKGPDFFEVDKYPAMTFRSRKFEAAGPGRLKITGDLTLHGVTREVVLDVEGPTPEVTQRGMARIGAAATAKVDRKAFGMNWNRALDTGGVVVGDDISITIDVELVRPVQPSSN